MNKNGQFVLIVLIIIVLFSIGSYFYFKQPFNNAPSRLNTDDITTNDCYQSYLDCVDIVEKKYKEATITFNEIKKFNGDQDAQDFFETWRGFFQITKTVEDYDTQGQVVLIAYTISGEDASSPQVAVCDERGLLTQMSKTEMGC
jgi:hypothetical protein